MGIIAFIILGAIPAGQSPRRSCRATIRVDSSSRPSSGSSARFWVDSSLTALFGAHPMDEFFDMRLVADGDRRLDRPAAHLPRGHRPQRPPSDGLRLGLERENFFFFFLKKKKKKKKKKAARGRAGTCARRSAPSRRRARCRCGADGPSSLCRRGGRGPRRAGCGAAGRSPVRSRRRRALAPRPRELELAPLGDVLWWMWPARISRRPPRPARRARGSASRPASCANARERRAAGGGRRRAEARPPAHRSKTAAARSSCASRSAPAWCRHGRTELSPTTASFREVHRLGRLPVPLELPPGLREARREREGCRGCPGRQQRQPEAAQERGRRLVLGRGPGG